MLEDVHTLPLLIVLEVVQESGVLYPVPEVCHLGLAAVLGKLQTFLDDVDKILAVELLSLLEHVHVDGDGNQALAVELIQLLDQVFIDRLSHADNLQASLLEPLHKARDGDNILGLACDIADVLLVLVHDDHQRHRLVQLLDNLLLDGLSHVEDLEAVDKAVDEAVDCHEAVPVLHDILAVKLHSGL